MAFIYEKQDPGTGKARWFAKIKLGTSYEVVSLKLLAPGNRRTATERARRLQVECDVGNLSDETREWMGEKTYGRFQALTGKAVLSRRAGSPECWESAWKGHLIAREAKDNRGYFEGKAQPDECHARFARMANIRRFVRWTEAEKIPFMGEPFTDLLIRFLSGRLNEVKPRTVRTSDYPYLVGWGEWMAELHLCERPDRRRILESIPEHFAPNIELPGWREDFDALRHFHSIRDTPIVGSTWRKQKGYRSVWSLILVVRGLGCRPSEATSLSWETVRIEEDRVRFLRSKTGKHRTVPIVFQWVKDGLVELAERNGRVGAVCISAVDEPYSRETIAASLIRRACLDAQKPIYHLKVAQKLWIRQMITTGFPPHVVAKWADHSLSMQEKHYCEEESYLPRDQDEDYGHFGKLTEFGQRTLDHLASFSRDFDMG